jgi:hypothetical protein
MTLGANCGSISTTSAPIARLVDAFADRGAAIVHRVIADQRIGAQLPQQQVGLGGDHGAVEALEHVGDFLAVDTAVEHGDRMAGEMAL